MSVPQARVMENPSQLEPPLWTAKKAATPTPTATVTPLHITLAVNIIVQVYFNLRSIILLFSMFVIDY